MNKEGLVLGPHPTRTVAGYPPLSRQRLCVLDYVRTHAPVRITAVAAALDLHPNTVREHLDALTGHGLAERVTETPSKRGRPAALYRPSAADPAIPAQDYAGLATALAGHIARTSTQPERDARAAGASWGHELCDDTVTTDDPRAAVLTVLARLGFGPDADGPDGSIALRSCPLLEAARRYPAIVCQVHLGIVEGVLERFGAVTDTAPELVAFAEPGACRLFLPDPVVPERNRP
ncbi:MULTISPECIES: helix-turn-helix transcriptional regulator [Mycolicibacterium]|uniref:Predicted transcriptional regulator n=2 Tax=Mycolicibacterium gilvum TaxID=1804 RepID=E6TN94_MYCSR|nr:MULTISPECIES: helix-turn-helix domain-containing protein [Mycolicibacterium]ABP45961.1 transcriptional regulator [Mycolicibacterium gilvum PYR-GCK]ADT99452.1 predicted transcriptional regulator [Mycolicibacterium gilvum Spyr1]MBV5246153.1 helix-turn-helix domain-containing protein [Mycolicibacterium sp. PAM1]